MKLPENMTYGVKGLVTTSMLALLVGCGGGGSSSSSGGDSSNLESVVSRGVITQLGSIWVNGCRYVETAGGQYKNDDDDSASFDDYQVGMNVSIKGGKRGGTTECEADEVEYEAEIEAEYNDGKMHDISILTTPSTNGPTMSNNNRYEVSGVWIDDSTLEATFVKTDDDGNDEIKGKVKNLGVDSFGIRNMIFVGYSGSPALSNDDFVEVHFDASSCSGTPVTCTLTSVELEDDFFDEAEGLEVEVEGAVNLTPGNCPAAADIEVDGVCVDSSAAEWMDGLASRDDLVDGSRVEAEGHMIAATPRDYMRADKIKGRGNRVRIESIAENVINGSPCTFTLIDSKITVEIHDCANSFEGDSSGGGPLTIDNLEGEEVEVRGVRTGATSMKALRIKESGLSGGGTRHEVRAEVDLAGANTANDPSTLTVMGLVTFANECTELEIGDVVISGDEACNTTQEKIDDFLNQVDDDTNAGNGPRHVVEIGFEIPNVYNGGTVGSGTANNPYLAEEWEIEQEDD